MLMMMVVMVMVVVMMKQEVTREAATLRDDIAALTDTMRDLAVRDNLLRDSKRRLDERRRLRAALQRNIQLKESTIVALRDRSVSLDEELAASNRRVFKLHTDAARILRKFADSLQVLLTLQKEVVMMELQIAELAQSHSAFNASLAESTKSLQAARAELVKLQNDKRSLYKVCRDLLLKSKEVCGLGPDDEAPPEMQQALEGGPETLDEIDAAIEDARTRASLLNINPQVLEEFENRRVAIEELQGEVETLRQTLGEQQRHLDTVKPQWLEPLGVVISQINAKFSSYLKTLNCAGEVDLFTDNEEDYAGYGLRLRVKFRLESSLHELTAHHQSGGERGVSTVLYLMALQSLHQCPLRVMDEINQGMDATNERRVFDIVVDTACSQHTGQSFFITPKLLPNLNFRPEVKVHIVFNGPEMITNPSTTTSSTSSSTTSSTSSTSSFFFGWDRDVVAKTYKK
ncbi:structural maintenance of chromosomes protein 5-like [Petromyzon marinus]|uniref:structural maintenance of chromosomes protein 5-like n=1 Tax=Petromyzon marinus TaxID=7757 RepID=UPI003F7085CB